MRTWLLVCVCLLHSVFAAAASATQKSSGYDLVSWWDNYTPATQRVFYTTDFKERNQALAAGAADHGVAAWIACAAGNLPGLHGEPPRIESDSNLGYPIPMSFACRRPAHSTPLYRYRSGHETNDFIYVTTSAQLDAQGPQEWTFERVEGYVLTARMDGSVPLHAMSKCAAAACSEHRYSISTDTRDTLTAAGWRSDGIVGYVFDSYSNRAVDAQFSGTLNGIKGAAPRRVRIPIQQVTPPAGTLEIGGNRRDHFLGELGSNSTLRPAGADRQRILFALYTGDLFEPATTTLDHIPVWLRGHVQWAADGQGGIPYDGLGIFFALPRWSNRCSSAFAGGGQIFVEAMAPARIDCAANLSTPLQSRRWYDISLTVSDAADLEYTVTDRASGKLQSFAKNYAVDYACPLTHAPGSLPLSKLHCNNPLTVDRFPRHRTGYFLWPIFTAASTTSASISAIKVQWLDSSGKILSSSGAQTPRKGQP